jgi:antitoxin component YwqK of YwqJK toxin-antitoxin module
MDCKSSRDFADQVEETKYLKMKHYRSPISKAAQERVVSTHKSNGQKQQVEYVLNGEVVGTRWFDEHGLMHLENPRKNGVTHGTMYHFDDRLDGILRVTFAEPYRNGLAHGTARQWSAYDGKLIGTYTMKRGTGIDFWRTETYSGSSVYLHETHYIKNGNWHGFEWWLNDDQASVHQEAHFWENLQHGIRREWNGEGKLKRGFPQYWVNNIRVTKRQYLRACAKDSKLPPFREIDNHPKRNFPPEVQVAIQETASLQVRVGN